MDGAAALVLRGRAELMGDVSAIFVQRGSVPAGKQTAACLAYIKAEKLPLYAIVPFWAPEDAVHMVRDGTVTTIVTAHDSRVVQRMATEIDGHGQVVYVHPVPTVIRPRRPAPGISELVRRWLAQGKTESEIATDIGRDTGDVRDIIRRFREPLD